MSKASDLAKFILPGVLATGLIGLVIVGASPSAKAEQGVVPAPLLPAPASVASGGTPGTRSIVLSGGCFWGVQGVFEHVRGVVSAVSGYAGGPASEATYEQVSTGTTGNAESVRITYDPKQISEAKLLQIFFSVVLDPTEHDEQGPDTGTQYRSEVWVSNPAEADWARDYIAQLDAAHVFDAKIATRVDMLPGFTPAEAYHQDYLALNPDNPYIEINDAPKVAALQRLFPADYVGKPVLTGLSSS